MQARKTGYIHVTITTKFNIIFIECFILRDGKQFRAKNNVPETSFIRNNLIIT